MKENFWVMNMKKRICGHSGESKGLKFVISDVRMQNELDMLNGLGGTIVKITRPTIEIRPKKWWEKIFKKNIEETERINLQGVNINISNDGSLDELYEKVEEYIL